MLTYRPDKKTERRMLFGALMTCILVWIVFGFLTFLLLEGYYLAAFICVFILLNLGDWLYTF